MKHNAECGLRIAEWARGIAVAGLVLLPLSHLSAQTSLSIYRDGRVVVRRSVPQALQQGRNTVTLSIEGLDPATLFSPDSLVAIVQATERLPSTPEDALRRAVRDPSLVLWTYSPEDGCYLDADGTPRELPRRSRSRAATIVEREGRPVGALVYDATLEAQPELLAAVRSAAIVALEAASALRRASAATLSIFSFSIL